VVVLAIVLIVLGVAFVVLGLAAATREVFRRSSVPPGVGGGALDPEAWEKLLRALTELVKVAPQWFLLTLVGAALVGVGGALL
jgi:hypothetical protein